ncbi:flagellar hook-length control protein FliK [Sphingobium cloacae]|uniref:Flagellar hook-length control protein-like C-terminal domain-containing protein n=2 Tax=Sphingobium cloacae TaxID=120107 RepID=A0A1E1F2B0_9SPHN|nr:flagellar hook-length control protein FliK [Sphingobium cloacae]BAV64653.1 hypothetical protein SCLO_1016130 [Sphingobium cloacae]
MNMLTSLKTLLFSSAAMKMPGTGDGAGAAPATGDVDFAALLSGSMQEGGGAVAGVPAPVMDAVAVGGEADMQPLPISPAEAEGTAQGVQGKPKARTEQAPERIAPTQAVAEAVAAPGEGEASAGDDEVEKVAGDASDAPPPLTPAPLAAPPVVAVTVAASPYQEPAASEADAMAEVTVRAAPPERISAWPAAQTGPVAGEPSAQAQTAPVASVPPSAAENAEKGAVGGPQSQANVAALPMAETVKDSGKGPNKPSVILMEGGAVPVAPSDDASPLAATLARSEALSLLQMVREQFSRVPVEGARAEAVAMPQPKSAREGKPVTVDPATAVAAIAQPDGAWTAAPLPPLTAAGAPVLPVVAPPSADLGASLGAQVVDMGVSGQWIDGLARDIAGLAQNGARGRFQINASQLGPVQVDIRQGADGAAVSLTVAHEAAELALKQDSDRLRLDAGLAAVRISDVRIERAPHVAEAARPDSAGQQPSGQQSSSQGAASGWQGMAQSERQGHGQGRENSASGLKGSADRAVINQKDAGEGAGDIRRARYA